MTSSLRVRLLVLVALAVVPGLASLLYAAAQERTYLEEDALGEVARLADVAAEQQQRVIDAARGMLMAFGEHPGVLAGDPETCTAAATRLKDRMPLAANIVALRPDGQVFCSAVTMEGPINLGDRTHIRRALATGEIEFSDFIRSRTARVPAMAMAAPVRGVDGSTVALVVASIDLMLLQRQLQDLQLPPGAVAVVADRHGLQLARKPASTGELGAPVESPLREWMLTEIAEPHEVAGADGAAQLFAVRPIAVMTELGLLVAVGIPREAARAMANRTLSRTLPVLALLAVLAVLATGLAAEHLVVRRVQRLADAARRIASGDTGARSGLRAGGDEIGGLIRAFDEMAGSIESLTERNRLILDSVGEGIVGVDGAGRITFVNPAAAQLLRRPPEDLLGLGLHGVVHGDHGAPSAHAEDQCPMLASLRDGAVHTVTGGHFTAADGRRLAVESVCTPKLQGSAIVGAVVAFRDVGERIQLEEQLRHAQKMEAVGRLAGGIAHDFNNLLTAIISCARFLEADLGPDHPSRLDVQDILTAGDRAASLTRQLLAYSRRQVLSPRIIDLGATLRGLESMLRRLLGEAIAVEVRCAPGLGAIRADPSQMEQVIVNLAVNARDAMPSGGRLLLVVDGAAPGEPAIAGDSTLPAGPLIALSVTDTGTGMDAATAARVFEPFFTSKPMGKGTGLGLSTVYGIVIQSGGAIRVRSEPGQGTTFTLYFPRVEGAPEGPALTAEVPPPAAVGWEGGAASVLVVEDDDPIRSIARRALESAGYRVMDAPDPVAALAMAEDPRRAIDLLVSDVALPRMSGVQLADRLRIARPALRVLFISGYTGSHLAEEGVLPAGLQLLPKPFAAADLLRRVAEVLATPAFPRSPIGPMPP